MMAIAEWANTELRLARLLAELTKTDKSTTAAIYLSLSGGAEARRKIINAAAEQNLSEADLELYRMTMRAIKPVRDRRNDFAHGMWGYTDELPDALLWAKPEHQVAQDIAMHEARVRGDKTELKRLAESQLPEVMVYGPDDLKSDQQRASEATMCVIYLTGALNQRDPAGDKQRARLCATSLVKAIKPNHTTP